MKKQARAAFVPTNAVLLRQDVKCDSARVVLSKESIAAGVTLALCLQHVLPKAVIRWVVEHFVLAEASTLRLIFVDWDLKSFRFSFPASATCEDLARHIHKERWWASLPIDTLWVHVWPNAGKVQLFWMGARANDCIAAKWDYFGQWTEEALTDEELHWLNSRTLIEAGFRDGSNVDLRYSYELDKVVSGELQCPSVLELSEVDEER